MSNIILPGMFIASMLVGLLAIPHRVGFVGGMLLSVLLTPVGALVVMVLMEYFWPNWDRKRSSD